MSRAAGVFPLDVRVLDALAGLADRADADAGWPGECWKLLQDAGVLRWSIPVEHGGTGLGHHELLSGYEQIAGACLTTAFILSQREAAVRRLLANPVPALLQRYLPALAAGEQFASVGLSQLTTSRQHQSPALLATPLGPAGKPTGYRLEGLIPWVTGADQADFLIVGGTLADGRQVLCVMPTDRPGVTVEPPAPLMALEGSRTSQIHCAGVELEKDLLLAGPAEKIMSAGRGGVGGLETSCLALGSAGAAVDHLMREAAARPDLLETALRFEEARQATRAHLHRLADGEPEQADLIALRVECTRLALQASQVALTMSKGAGFVVPHPAQRWVRQSAFFLVWSCPRPAAEGLISHLVPETSVG
jgi:alkylation response protein AidB-like acyl-CoA dehydrogenase